ncbi:hypothetical protein GCM10015536_32550 [Streptomyces griseomycini]|nr:hypothetical protein GCM10015536_32550 [Streptomyces griseomycini]
MEAARALRVDALSRTSFPRSEVVPGDYPSSPRSHTFLPGSPPPACPHGQHGHHDGGREGRGGALGDRQPGGAQQVEGLLPRGGLATSVVSATSEAPPGSAVPPATASAGGSDSRSERHAANRPTIRSPTSAGTPRPDRAARCG